MTEVRARSSRLLALACLFAPLVAPAVPQDGGYLEATYARDLGGGPADGGPAAVGAAGAARIPLSRNWFVTGWAQRLDPYVDGFGGRHEEEDRFEAGFGARRSNANGELFGQVKYLKIENWRQAGHAPRVEGGALSFGARNLVSDHVELRLEGSMGYVEGGLTHELILSGRGALAYEVVPHVWLFAEGSLALFDYTMGYAGVRFSFPGPQPARLPPAVRHADRDGPPGLAAGVTLVAQRPLQLQVRPAFGAPETIVVPAGGSVSLVETIRNDFGNWWRVRAGEQQGWIREGHLK